MSSGSGNAVARAFTASRGPDRHWLGDRSFTVLSDLTVNQISDQVVVCPVCLSGRTKNEPYYYGWKEREWRLYRCSECTHQFVFPSVTRTEQDEIYGDAYFSGEGDWGCGVFDGSYFEAEQKLVDEAKQVLSMLPIESGRVLEIGCAGGFFLREARRAGLDVFGIEPNERMAAHARENLNIEVICSRIGNRSRIPTVDWSLN
jgi:SAM-dependent methyltransferase